MTSLKLC